MERGLTEEEAFRLTDALGPDDLVAQDAIRVAKRYVDWMTKRGLDPWRVSDAVATDCIRDLRLSRTGVEMLRAAAAACGLGQSADR